MDNCIKLIFRFKQYKNANSANFVSFEKTLRNTFVVPIRCLFRQQKDICTNILIPALFVWRQVVKPPVPAIVFLSLIFCRLKLLVLVRCVARVTLCLRLQDVEIRRLRTGRQFTSGVPAYRVLERHLLSVCFISLVAYRAFCVIAAVSQDETTPPSNPYQKDELILLLGNYGNHKLV